MINLDEWDEAGAQEVSTKELDELVVNMQETYADYEKEKKIATETRLAYEELQKKVLEMLKKAGKTKWNVDGLGTVSIRGRYQYTTPKGLTSKGALFEYIKQKHGPDALMGLLSIHSGTLNSFANEEKEREPLVEIPGLDPPTHRESLSFRKGK